MPQSMVPIYIPASVFATLTLVYVVVLRMLLADRLRISERIEQHIKQPATEIRTEMDLDFVAEETEERPRRQSLRRRLKEAGPVQRLLIRLQDHLDRANILLRANEFLLIMLVIVGVLAVMGYLLRGVVGAAMLAVMAPAIPWLYVVRARVQRTNAITDQLPDVLVLISNGLKAGHGFLQAAELVAQEMDPPIGEEFEKFLRETSLGSTTEKALNSLNERCDNDDLDLAITAVLIQRQIGGNLAEILDRILHTIRERIRIKQEIRTLTAQGRMSAIIITLLPPAVGIIIYFLSPEFMTLLLTTKIGIGMLVGAAVSELIGALIIRNIVDIEV